VHCTLHSRSSFALFFFAFFGVRHADEWQSTLVAVHILFQVFRNFWNFLVKVIDHQTFLHVSQILQIFGKVIDQLNHFTCKSMESHNISI
jgi:hypothetical protein